MGKILLNDKKGSVLIESIVAISLVTVGILGIISLLAKSSSFYNGASNQLTATYLAAEGVEIAKNILDAGYIDGKSWGWLSDGWYYVDAESYGNALLPIENFSGPASADLLNFVPNSPNDPSAGGSYSRIITGGVPTLFRRVVKIENGLDSVTNTGYINVISYVNWNEKGENKQIILEDRFYNWRS
jgi:hypothetical protein